MKEAIYIRNLTDCRSRTRRHQAVDGTDRRVGQRKEYDTENACHVSMGVQNDEHPFLLCLGRREESLSFFLDTLVRNAGFEGYLKEDTEIVYKNGDCEISYRDGKLNTGYKFDAEELSLEKIAFVSDKRNLISDIMAARIPKKVDSFYLNETLEDFRKATKVIQQHDMPYLKVSLSLEKTANGERYFIKVRLRTMV